MHICPTPNKVCAFRHHLNPVTQAGAILLLNHSVPQKDKTKQTNKHQDLKQKRKTGRGGSQSLAEGVPERASILLSDPRWTQLSSPKRFPTPSC